MIEKIILANLVLNDSFTRKVIPYILPEYFEDRINEIVFILLSDYIKKYNNLPSKEALSIDLLDAPINDEEKNLAEHLILSLAVDPKTDMQWVMNETEEFCKKRAMYLALVKSLEIYENKDGKQSLGAIPKIMTSALGVSFDANLGHDFFKDSDLRYDYYHQVVHKVPFDVNVLNRITRGGASKKTLTVLMAGVHVGKSALMCHMAAGNLRDNKKVLYISLEMSSEMISQRIEANLMDITLDEVFTLPEEQYKSTIKKLRSLYGGELRVKEYGARQGGSANFRYFLNEMKLKEGFIPDIIYVDYMNICTSSTATKNAPKHEVVIAISEELRGLAFEFDVPIITATQFNKEGFKSSDPGLDNTAESFGSTGTGDLILALVRTEEMDALGQLMVIQLKNRFSDMNKLKRFVIGVNIEKMQFYDVEDEEQTLMGTKPEDFATPDMQQQINQAEELGRRFNDVFN